ncbi:hypothetical protein AAAA28_04520 [Providencia stuartii]|uniref:hypothetical protein n=1 Tax=Providencia stuartii TaxID=588 RepID=UPI0030F01FDF
MINQSNILRGKVYVLGDNIEINLETNQIVIPGETLNMAPIGELANIVSAGGLFAYARQNEKM